MHARVRRLLPSSSALAPLDRVILHVQSEKPHFPQAFGSKQQTFQLGKFEAAGDQRYQDDAGKPGGWSRPVHEPDQGHRAR